MSMTTQEQIRKVTDIAQEKGWSISVEDENKTSIQFEFQRYTKYGQDFNFNADMQDEDINTLIAGMKRYYEDFDPDYEAYLWIGDDGHGRNGAPYHIKDIVSDMEEAEEQIYTSCCKHLKLNLSVIVKTCSDICFTIGHFLYLVFEFILITQLFYQML